MNGINFQLERFVNEVVKAIEGILKAKLRISGD